MCRLFFCSRGKNRDYFADPVLFFPALIHYNKAIKEVYAMTVRERILALRLLEKQKKQAAYSRRIGIFVTVKKKEEKHA